MKKLYIFVLMLGLFLFANITHALDNIYVTYDISIRDNVRVDIPNGSVYMVGANRGARTSQKVAIIDKYVGFNNMYFHIIFWYRNDEYLGLSYNQNYVTVSSSPLITNAVNPTATLTNLYPGNDATHFIVLQEIDQTYSSTGVSIHTPITRANGILESNIVTMNYAESEFKDFDQSMRTKYTYDLIPNAAVNVNSGVFSNSQPSIPFYDYKYTTSLITITHDMVFYDLPFWHVISWYRGATYLGFSYNSSYVGYIAPSTPTLISQIDPTDTNTNIYPDNATHMRIMIVESNLAASDTYVSYTVGINSTRLNAANFYFFTRDDITYDVKFPMDVNGNYIGRAYELNGFVGGGVVPNPYWVTSELVEIKNNFVGNYPSVRFSSGYDTENPLIELSTLITTGSYNFDIIVWFVGSNYVGFSVTDNIKGVSATLDPYYLGFITRKDIGKNVIPLDIFFTATHFRVMSWKREINKSPYTAPFPLGAFPDPANMGNFLLNNTGLPVGNRVGVDFYYFDDLITRFTYINNIDIEQYDFMYLRNYSYGGIQNSVEFYWNNVLSMLNLSNEMGRLLASLIIILIIVVVLFIYKASLGIIFFTIIVGIVTFGLLGWVEQWLILSIVVIASIVLIIKTFANLGKESGD